MFNLIPKPYLIGGIIALLFLFGAWSFTKGNNHAVTKNNKAVIEEGKKDINVEKRQTAIRANRSNYNLSKRLRSGSF